MLNQVVLVGRLTADPEITVTSTGKKITAVTIAVQRTFKNMNGLYDTDFIKCTLWNGIAETTCEYCKKGDVVGVKGRIQTSSYESNGEKKYSMDIIAEKVSYLSSKKADE